MTTFTVPLNTTYPWQTSRIVLSGTIFTLEFRYNLRMSRWIMNVEDAAGNPILMGIPILIGINLTDQYATLAIPEGEFIATDDSGQGAQATQFSFGIDHTLSYIDPTQ